TYTGWGGVATNAFERLAATGGLPRRAPAPSAALTRARDAVSRLIVNWDDKLADDIAAGNLVLDQSKDRRRAAIAELRRSAGACTASREFDDLPNALRGTWTMKCDKGALRVAMTLAPTTPPKVQLLEVRSATNPALRTDACQQ